MKEKKYELIPSDKEGLFRIKALRDFSDVRKGEIGGYASGEYNLSHNGLCWIYGEAIVCDSAEVYDDVIVADNAKVYGNALVFGDAKVYGNAKVYGYVNVSDGASVFGNAEVHGNAWVRDNACVCDNAIVSGNAKVYDNADVYGNASVCGNAWVNGYADICGNAVIKDMGDYIVFQNAWSSGRYFTWTRSNNMWKVGCFYGTGEELIKKAYQDSEVSGTMYEVTVNCIKELLKVDDITETKKDPEYIK